MKLSVIILAAGNGERMCTQLPKVLHQLGGVPLLERVVDTAYELKPDNVFVVHGNGNSLVQQQLNHLPVNWVPQSNPLGTGDATKQVLPYLKQGHRVLVLYGDVPLIREQTLTYLLSKIPADNLGILTANVHNPTGLGRIIRDPQGSITAVIEDCDATPAQQQIREINTGIMTTSIANLQRWLPKLQQHNAQKEYYLTDIVAMAVAEGIPVHGVMAPSEEEVQGVNNLVELAKLEHHQQQQIAYSLMQQGVKIIDPSRFDLRGKVTVGKDTVIDINVVLHGKVTIGSNCHIEPNVILRNVTLGNNVTILANSVIEDAVIDHDCSVGPFSRIRPGTHLASNTKVGNFVEIKNSQIKQGSKINHLSYVGDTEIGKAVNIGAGTITCNYDGVNKHKTIIKDQASIGSNTSLVAPVTIGEQATIGAGSTITEDAPDQQLTIARARQQSMSWKKPKK